MKPALPILLAAAFTLSPAYAGQEIVINGVVNDNVYGNGVMPHGTVPGYDYTYLGDPNDNSVTVESGGSVIGYVYGGYAYSTSGSATATGNSVFINGGSVDGYVIGGRAYSSSGMATATNNLVTLSGNPTFIETPIQGGLANSATSDVFSGNTLRVWDYSGSPVRGIADFATYDFLLPATLPSGGVALKVTDRAFLNDGSGSHSTTRASTITNISTLGDTPRAPGYTVTLIQAYMLYSDLFTQTHATGSHGATLQYDWALAINGNHLDATLLGVEAAPSAKAFSEAFLGGLIAVTQAGDFTAGPGLANAVTVTRRAGLATRFGIPAFGAISGSRSRYNTGSHVDVSGFSFMAGLAKGFDFNGGQFTLGAFFEHGTASYDTYNAFSNAATVEGDGDMQHTGGGLLGRMDFSNRFYIEGSARLGRAKNEYKSNGIRYDTSSPYYGLHVGGGYLWSLNEQASLDLHTKYFWTRQEGDSVTLSTGDEVTFKDADSQRLRLGGRFAYAVNQTVSPYAGLAYEHEFDGKARATTYGHAIDAPSMRGDTGIAEMGLTLTPSASLPLSFDLGVQGYAGKREGVTGSVALKWAF